MANSITNTNTRIATTIEDFFKELLKLLDQSDAFEKDSLFLGALKKDGNAPALINIDTVIAKRLVHEMEKKQIPYMQFRIRATGKDVLMVRPEDMPLIKDIENSIRIHAGLELDTKAELDRALALTDPSAKEYIIESSYIFTLFILVNGLSMYISRLRRLLPKNNSGKRMKSRHRIP